MRCTAIITILAALSGVAPSLAASAGTELLTVQNAILCMSPDNVRTANEAAVAKRPPVLKAMGCIRSPGGIRSQLLNDAPVDEPWEVRFYPAGISAGVVLWGLASAFAQPAAELPVRKTGF